MFRKMVDTIKFFRFFLVIKHLPVYFSFKKCHFRATLSTLNITNNLCKEIKYGISLSIKDSKVINFFIIYCASFRLMSTCSYLKALLVILMGKVHVNMFRIRNYVLVFYNFKLNISNLIS